MGVVPEGLPREELSVEGYCPEGTVLGGFTCHPTADTGINCHSISATSAASLQLPTADTGNNYHSTSATPAVSRGKSSSAALMVIHHGKRAMKVFNCLLLWGKQFAASPGSNGYGDFSC